MPHHSIGYDYGIREACHASPTVRRVLFPRRLSARKLKSLRPSPSKCLVKALISRGHEHALPPVHPLKKDLSYFSARRMALGLPSRPTGKRFRLVGPPTRISLQSILGSYIRNAAVGAGARREDALASFPTEAGMVSGSGLKRETSFMLSEDELAFLRGKGYNIGDVEIWASIILAPDSYNAAQMLATAAREETSKLNRQGLTPSQPKVASKPTPIFVFMFLLRRRLISARALRLLLSHARYRLRIGRFGTDDHSPSAHVHMPLDQATVFAIFVRLLRHARLVLPQAIGSVAEIIRSYLNKATEKGMPQLSFLYSRALSLLSTPASVEPFRHSRLQKEVQFDVLRTMDKSNVPIIQEGYRAITRTQVAQKKTSNEQEWARLKAKSWPPFKEDRTGIDVEKGVELGMSGAVKAVEYMQQMGYPAGPWDHMAKIYAGWDTDGSPTIQTRKMMPKMPSSVPKESTSGIAKPMQSSRKQLEIWVARIEATRTLEEAWASFLAYEGTGLPVDQEVYLAMFRKIHYDEKRRNGSMHKQDNILPSFDAEKPLPGDGREVFPSSESPQERVYVPTPPPSLDALFNRLVAKGVKSPRACQTYLISHAPSLEVGIKFVLESGSRQISCLMLRSAEDVEMLPKVHKYVLAAFVGILCRFSHVRQVPHLKLSFLRELSAPTALQGSELAIDHPMKHVDRLMSLTKTKHRPLWNAMLGAFASNKGFVRQLDGAELHLIRDIVKRMRDWGLDLDAAGFQSICRAFENAATSDTGAKRSTTNAACSQYLRHLFLEVVGGNRAGELLDTADVNGLPRLLTTPGPALLHQYTRALGALEDYEGLLSLAQWMVQYKPELHEAVEDSASRGRLMRRTLTALRVFLESGGEATSEVVALARGFLDQLPEWGGWPSDEDVEVYISVQEQRVEINK